MTKLPLVVAVCATLGMVSVGAQSAAEAQSRASGAAVARARPVAKAASIRTTVPKARTNRAAHNLGLIRTKAPTGTLHHKVPIKISGPLKLGNAVERAKLVDYFRRLNTTAELMSVLDGRPLSPVKEGLRTKKGFLDAGNLSIINTHLEWAKRSFDPNRRPSTYVSAGAMAGGEIGFRLGSFGDPNRPFSLEIRTLPGDTTSKRPFVDSVLREVNGGTYGAAATAVEAWHEANVATTPDKRRGVVARDVEKQSKALSSLHYNRPVKDLLEKSPSALRPQLTRGVQRVLRQQAGKHNGLKMLVHDWSRDPALAGKPEALERILRAQQNGLRALPKGSVRGMFAGKDRYQTIVRNFVAESGLTKVMADSVGVDLGR